MLFARTLQRVGHNGLSDACDPSFSLEKSSRMRLRVGDIFKKLPSHKQEISNHVSSVQRRMLPEQPSS